MSGSVTGGKLAAKTNKAKDADYYRKIGKLGGSTKPKTPRGFAAIGHERASAAGAKGGRISRRGRAKPKNTFDELFVMPEPFAEGFGKSRWYERLLRRKHE